MMKFFFTVHILIIFISLIGIEPLKAQYTYSFADDIEYIEGTKTYDFPMAGGLNSPSFGEFDLNLDGKMDLLIMERYGSAILPFINIGNPGEVKYKYDPNFIDLFPKNITYWIATADFNCDGKNDLIYASLYQEMIAYENISNVSNGFRLGNPSKLTYPTSWSNSFIPASSIDKPAIMDVDNDGDIDILQFLNNSQIAYFKNMSLENTNTCGLQYIRAGLCWGDVSEDFLTSEIYLDSCINGDISGGERNKANKHAGSSILGFDINGNLTTDILVGDVSKNNLTLLVNGDNSFDRTDSHIISKDSLFPSYDTSINLFSFPAGYYMDVDNDDLKDLIVASFNFDRVEPVATKKNIHYYKNIGTQTHPHFSFKSQDFLLGNMIDLGIGAYPVFFDHNKDGKMDIVAGNIGHYDSTLNHFVGKLSYFENVGTIQKPQFELKDHDYAEVSSLLTNNQFVTSQALTPAFADLDNDGKSELLIGDNSGKLNLFTDTSSANNPAAFSLIEREFDNINTFYGSYPSPTFYDLNKDGLLDLIIGNNRGTLTYYPNWGTATNPIFNLKVDSIIHQSGSIMRYYFESSTDLSRLSVGDSLVFNSDSIFNYDYNSGKRDILIIDNVKKFVDVNSYGVTDTFFVNEFNSKKTAFYGIENFGGIDIRNRYSLNGGSTPYFYDFEGETKMLSGSKIGTIYHYSNIDNNLDSTFTLTDTNYLDWNFGDRVYLSGGDLNGDDKEDLLVGNEAGGFKVFYASGTIGIDERKKKDGNLSFVLYPNPTRNYFTVKIQGIETTETHTVRILNYLGAVVQENTIEEKLLIIPTTELSTGIYLVEVSNSKNKQVKKIVVQH